MQKTSIAEQVMLLIRIEVLNLSEVTHEWIEEIIHARELEAALEIDSSSFPRGLVVDSQPEAGQIKSAKKILLE